MYISLTFSRIKHNINNLYRCCISIIVNIVFIIRCIILLWIILHIKSHVRDGRCIIIHLCGLGLIVPEVWLVPLD